MDFEIFFKKIAALNAALKEKILFISKGTVQWKTKLVVQRILIVSSKFG